MNYGGSPFSREAVQCTPELERILAMPRRVWSGKALEQLIDRMTELLKTPAGTMRLKPVQAIALYELGTTGGLLGPIQVGGGKELCCMLAARVMFSLHPLLLMPAHLVARSEDEMAAYAVHWRIPTNLRILSYQMLSQANRSETLSMVPPDLFILNEVHRIKNKNAAVTRRVVRHMAKFPNAKFVAVSGTLLSKSIMDFEHIARWCVKPCPLPADHGSTQEWSDALDEKPGSWNNREPGALLKFCNEEELKEDLITAARRGFRRRLTETPGVVASSGEDDVAHANGDPITLTVRAISYDQDPIVEQHFKKLREEWSTPSGWDFSLAMEVWRHARTLALGLHYSWDPPPEGGPEGPWMMVRRAWKKFVRAQIKASRTLDSELQVANACDKGALDSAELNAWRTIQPSYVPKSKADWHCDGALNACQRWISDGPGIVFTDHTFFARELAKRSGCRYFGAGGLDADGAPIEKADPNSCVIASRVANSTGRNLQFWNRALVTAAPANATEWEQMVGRLHRTGQTRDVTVDVLLGCVENSESWSNAHALAKMTNETMGASQKLLIAKVEFPDALDLALRQGYKWQKTLDKS